MYTKNNMLSEYDVMKGEMMNLRLQQFIKVHLVYL